MILKIYKSILNITIMRCLFDRAKMMNAEKPQEWETIESFIVPLLRHFDWPCDYQGLQVSCRRNSGSDFDLIFASAQDILMGVEAKRFSNNLLASCASSGSNSASNKTLPEQVVAYYKQGDSVNRGMRFGRFSRIVWTNGVCWVIFKDASLREGISGTDLYAKFSSLRDDPENEFFKMISLWDQASSSSETEFRNRISVLASIIGFESVWADYAQFAHER